MATDASRDYKRIDIYRELLAAARELRKLSCQALTASDALMALARAQGRIRRAAEQAKPSVHQWTDEKGPHEKISRDALPKRITRRALRLADLVETLAEDVRAMPVTREQRALAKVARQKAMGTHGT